MEAIKQLNNAISVLAFNPEDFHNKILMKPKGKIFNISKLEMHKHFCGWFNLIAAYLENVTTPGYFVFIRGLTGEKYSF